MQIAIDGPSGSGKSTIAKRLAADLRIIYVNTGSMYRAIAYYCIKNGIDMNDENKVCQAFDRAKLSIKYINNEQKIILNDVDITNLIRTQDVAHGASCVAKYAKIRARMVDFQKKLCSQMDCIMEGRDIGTVVMPNADVKIFLTASVDERTTRRCGELKEKGTACDYDTIRKEIENRDWEDTNRELSPLVKADDAIELDTTTMSIDEVASFIFNLAKEKEF